MAEPNYQAFFTNPGLFHIAETILVHLETKDLAKIRLVSRAWKDLIDHSRYLGKNQVEDLKAIMVKIRDRHCKEWNNHHPWAMVHEERSKPFSMQFYNDLLEKTNLHDLKIVVLFLRNHQVPDPSKTMFNGSNMVVLFNAIHVGPNDFFNDSFVQIVMDKIDLTRLESKTTSSSHRHRSRHPPHPSMWSARLEEPDEDPKLLCDYCNFECKTGPEMENHLTTQDHVTKSLKPLKEAIKAKHVNIIKLILKIHDKLDINLKVQDETLLHFACKYGSLRVVKFLINLWGLGFEQQKYLIHAAAEGGHESTVEYFLNKDLNFANVQDLDGNTPLHCACKFGHMDIVKVLVNEADAYNINLNAKNKDGLTPFDVAFNLRYMRIVQFLLDESMNKCIDVNVENEMSMMSKKKRLS